MLYLCLTSCPARSALCWIAAFCSVTVKGCSQWKHTHWLELKRVLGQRHTAHTSGRMHFLLPVFAVALILSHLLSLSLLRPFCTKYSRCVNRLQGKLQQSTLVCLSSCWAGWRCRLQLRFQVEANQLVVTSSFTNKHSAEQHQTTWIQICWNHVIFCAMTPKINCLPQL